MIVLCISLVEYDIYIYIYIYIHYRDLADSVKNASGEKAAVYLIGGSAEVNI